MTGDSALPDDLHARGNLLEAFVWWALAAGFAFYAWRSQGARRRLCLIACGAFAAFGLSDIVEIRSGAWWRPWWLLVWKAACLAVMVWVWFRAGRLTRSAPDP